MLKVKNLRKAFKGKPVVDGLSFSVETGETVVLTGPSGCGKSTTLRCINRLVEPDAGEIYLDDTPVLSLDEDELLRVRRRIGFVFQHFNLVGRLTAIQNVALPLVAMGTPKEDALIRSKEMLDLVGLDGHYHKRPDEMSGGQQQRVGIARALATDPDVMLWDEPTASLDPILVAEVLDLMRRLVSQTDKTMVIVTHEIRFAMEVADRVILLQNGRLAEEGTPFEVFEHPRSEVGRRYHSLLRC